jgi:hypothetical protein
LWITQDPRAYTGVQSKSFSKATKIKIYETSRNPIKAQNLKSKAARW